MLRIFAANAANICVNSVRKNALQLCTNDTLIGCLWPDEPADQRTKARLRKYVKDLKDVFAKAGMSGAIKHQERIGIGLDISMLDCDYFRYLQGDSVAVHQFKGQYMSQYDFADETRAILIQRLSSGHDPGWH